MTELRCLIESGRVLNSCHIIMIIILLRLFQILNIESILATPVEATVWICTSHLTVLPPSAVLLCLVFLLLHEPLQRAIIDHRDKVIAPELPRIGQLLHDEAAP